MAEREIWSFFYGSFMNREVMAKVGHVAQDMELATLPGFELVIAPHANIVPKAGAMVFGILTRITHDVLAALYETQSRGEVYLPEAVITLDARGRQQPAICYCVTEMAGGIATSDYVETIAALAVQYGFPDWYVERMRSFVGA